MDQVDDFYFSVLADSDELLLPISDEKYADGLQLQEVLFSSAVAALNRYGFPLKKVKHEKGEAMAPKTQPARIKTERGESSSSIKSEAFCKICMEFAPASAMFLNTNCSHAFCRDCLRKYISTKIQVNISTVKCPEESCVGLLEPEHCQEIIPKDVFERWGDALCEAMILGSNNFSYCPFKDCSALMLADRELGVAKHKCPSCGRMFCAKCNVAWHSGVSCEGFQRLGPDERGGEDLKLLEIAKRKKWMRCPKCKYYVEKTQGCLHVTCRLIIFILSVNS